MYIDFLQAGHAQLSMYWGLPRAFSFAPVIVASAKTARYGKPSAFTLAGD
jgi:hypothetical protein